MTKLLLSILFWFQTGIYSLHFTANNGTDMSFSTFQGKKILIVNTATNSKYSSQYGALENLYEAYKDSLVIVAIPSNDFGHEHSSDQDIADFISTHYNIHYILAAKQSVVGENASTLYKWLSQSSHNGIMDNSVPGDFTKFLIDSQGNIMGIFSGSIDPMSDAMQAAVSQ